MRPLNQLLGATALVVLASAAACKNDGGATGSTAQEGQYKGAIAGESSPNLSASLNLTVAASTTGSITPVGAAPINVTGTYVASTRVVAVSGGGYAITGTIDNTGNLLGTYTHSTATGTVVAYQHTTANPVTVFCGIYSGDAEGIWNPVRRGSSLSGVYVNVDGSDGSFRVPSTAAASASPISTTAPAPPTSAHCPARLCRARGRVMALTREPGPAPRPADRVLESAKPRSGYVATRLRF